MKEKHFINLTLLHIGIGFLLAFYPQLSKIYTLLIVLVGFYIVVKNKNKNNEILYVIAYIAGSEVFLRTTNGNPLHEFGKYSMLFFTCLGFYYNGFPKIRNPYWAYLLLLLPTVYLSFMYLDGDFRRKISFEILGPICLGVLALYSYKRKISIIEINIVLTSIALPILASCVYLILRYSHNIYPINSHSSNFYYSGEYAPNQMATALGLGVFVYFIKAITESASMKMYFLNIIFLCLIFYRGLLTFSRGGIVTGLIAVCIVFISMEISKKGYFLKRKIGISLFIITTVFILTAYQTEGHLFERYTNFNIFHTKNNHKPKGRYIQITSDIKNFSENPIVGIGVGKGKEIRKATYSLNVSTHSEITRLLSEHGIFGLFALLILIFVPLQLYFNDLKNVYLLSFFIFWLFTINHSATRIIAPLFMYSLALMKIEFEKEENSVVSK